jgi:hypothetical protein
VTARITEESVVSNVKAEYYYSGEHLKGKVGLKDGISLCLKSE